MDFKAQVLEILKAHIQVDEKALLKDAIQKLLFPILDGFVKDTSNPYDDKLLQALENYVNGRLA